MTAAENDPTVRADEPCDTTVRLLDAARQGDEVARDRLLRRYLPRLTRWATGRLPIYARSGTETEDLVQIALLRALRHLDRFAPAGRGAFFAYLRGILMNEIRDQIRRAERRRQTPLDDDLPDRSASPLELAIASDTLARYEAALLRLSPQQREAVMLRVELGLSYGEIAEALGHPSPNAARMSVVRGIARLAERMAPATAEQR